MSVVDADWSKESFTGKSLYLLERMFDCPVDWYMGSEFLVMKDPSRTIFEENLASISSLKTCI